MKTILLTSLLAVALSSGAAVAGARHSHHHLAYNHVRQYAQDSYRAYAPAPVETPRYHDPFGTYDVEPSPVTDQ
ncbi:MAG: hypothetical protein AB1508_05960 [Pseudomonadota bacterium]